MHEFHITTYVLTCDECGMSFGDGTERYAGDLIQRAKNNNWQVIVKSPTDSYYCPSTGNTPAGTVAKISTGQALIPKRETVGRDPCQCMP